MSSFLRYLRVDIGTIKHLLLRDDRPPLFYRLDKRLIVRQEFGLHLPALLAAASTFARTGRRALSLSAYDAGEG